MSMYASPLILGLAKVSVVPALSAAFGAAAVWFYHTKYFSSESRGPTSSQAVTATIPSNQEPGCYNPDDRLSLRETKPPNLKSNPATIAQLAHRDDKPGLDLQVINYKYKMTFDQVTEGNKAIENNLGLGGLPYRFPLNVFIPRNVAWSTQNLGLLTQQLHSLWAALGGGQRCTELTIRLPSIRLNEVTSGTGVLGFTTEVLLPSNLETLRWIGHREQLSMFFQLQPGFTTLVNLTIHCELSMDDCRTLLYWGRKSLQSVAFWTIKNVNQWDARVSLPPAFLSVENIQMTALRSLTIASTVDIRPLYSTEPLIRFPILETVTLKILDPAFNIFDCWRWLTMGGMQHVPNWDVHCRMSREQKSRMKQHYRTAVLKCTRPTPNEMLPRLGDVMESNPF